MIDDTLKPPKVIILKRAAAMMRRDTHIVRILVIISMLTVQVGIESLMSLT